MQFKLTKDRKPYVFVSIQADSFRICTQLLNPVPYEDLAEGGGIWEGRWVKGT